MGVAGARAGEARASKGEQKQIDLSKLPILIEPTAAYLSRRLVLHAIPILPHTDVSESNRLSILAAGAEWCILGKGSDGRSMSYAQLFAKVHNKELIPSKLRTVQKAT